MAFARVSIDLIIGVPKAAKTRLADDLQLVRSLGVGHVSSYMLTVEPETTLHKLVQLKRRDDVEEDQQADEYEQVQQSLHDAGFVQYEISSFAKPGQESRHNRLYWSKGTWLGLGPGAHGLAIANDGSHIRRSHDDNVEAWTEHFLPQQEERLSPEHSLVESLAFGLRDLGTGVTLADLEARHRCAVTPQTQKCLDQEIAIGNLVHTDGKLENHPVRNSLCGRNRASVVAYCIFLKKIRHKRRFRGMDDVLVWVHAASD